MEKVVLGFIAVVILLTVVGDFTAFLEIFLIVGAITLVFGFGSYLFGSNGRLTGDSKSKEKSDEFSFFTSVFVFISGTLIVSLIIFIMTQ